MEPGFIEFKLPSTYLLLEGSCVVAWCTSDGQLSMQVIGDVGFWTSLLVLIADVCDVIFLLDDFLQIKTCASIL